MRMQEDTRTILVRYGEIGLKGKNRALFENRLMDNLRAVIPREGIGQVRKDRGRIFVDPAPDADTEGLLSQIARTFGVVSTSPARVVALEEDTIERAILSEARRALHARPNQSSLTFKVETRRPNKGYPYTSPQINAWLGAVVLRDLGDVFSVDVHAPDVLLQVEIRNHAAYIMGHTVRGPGGLPVGSSGRALLLMSGGIDSPVAAWQMMKRGLSIEAIHFYTPPFTGPRARRKVEDLAAALAPWGAGFTLHLCHFTDPAVTLHERCPRRLHLTIMRRMMLRQASALARHLGLGALVTGDSLGQVASQTLENIVATDDASRVPVLRPLIGLDKEEIMDRARVADTYDISILPHEDCCTVFVPSDPKTMPSLQQVLDGERNLPEHLLGETVQEVETLVFGPDGTMSEKPRGES